MAKKQPTSTETANPKVLAPKTPAEPKPKPTDPPRWASDDPDFITLLNEYRGVVGAADRALAFLRHHLLIVMGSGVNAYYHEHIIDGISSTMRMLLADMDQIRTYGTFK